ncbi:hypothetical protein GJU43_21905 [Flavobacterium sp. LC2016-23]|uniref:hypothetical protein n=1 Tax=Flavobacterium sp. LC2016-23 TaxID=2666330 RepID=UPI0012B1439A|nr:hypothetical protein [Flavobacterium sp. LC2016-23]MRX41942.1 hypothetical protein [Flavobacterium sp. LC2016-23]
MKLTLFKLSDTNTAPFVLISLLYSILLLSPFIYFAILKSSPHTSYYVSYDEEKGEIAVPSDANDSTEIQMGVAPANNFDDEDLHASDKDVGESEGSNTVTMLNALTDDWKSNSESRQFRMLTRVATFSLICGFGALGAAISLITRTRNKELIHENFFLSEILAVQTIGAIFAMILGFAFLGNMISGTLFPNPRVFYRILYIPPAFGKLVVWSFIAGFSERLVPNILNNLTKKSDITRGDSTDTPN